ncbi:Endogenous retrovirus group K member 11 Pol protein [Dictyocoela muelleri]|nr:Endogenous retrovirus group K member 11 Pol protein [Dictyocoela muelleri]
MDLFSRYSEIEVIFDTNSETICRSFESNWLKKHLRPKKCLSDNGKQFISQKFKNLLAKYGIEHITSAPYNPTGNSLVERSNKEIGIVLRLSKEKSLSELKRSIWRRLNCTVNTTTEYSPYEIYFEKAIFENYLTNMRIDKDKIRLNIKKRRDKYETEMKRRYKMIKYSPVDNVYIRNNSQNKLESKWKGLYTVVKCSSRGNN